MPCHQIRSAHLLQFIMPSVLTKTMIMGHNNGNNSDSSNSKIKIPSEMEVAPRYNC